MVNLHIYLEDVLTMQPLTHIVSYYAKININDHFFWQVRGLYKGMSSPMSGVAVVNAIIFGVHGNMSKQMKEPDSIKYDCFQTL